MRKRSVAAVLALAVFGAAGYALAASVSVTLTSAGPQPATVTVNWGDTVVFSNGDSVEHGISIPRSEVSSPAIPPGGTFEHAFEDRGGNYNFQQIGPRNRTGRVVVEVKGSVTLATKTQVLPYGKRLTLTGRSSFPGKPVALRSRDAGAGGDWKVLLSKTAAADGSYSVELRPQVGARYEARVAADQIRSGMVDVAVKPIVTIAVPRRRGPEGTQITVNGRIRPATAVNRAELSAWDTRRKRWVPLQTRQVARTGKVVFRAELEAGTTRIRIATSRGSTAAGYVPTNSKFVRVVGTKKKET